MRNLTVLGSDSDTQIKNMYYRLNQLCYHIAFHMLKDVEKAEEVTQLALIRLMENRNYLKDDIFQIKSYASVITQHICLMQLRKNREEMSSLNGYIDSSYITLKYVGDAELYSLIKAISLMSVNDRLVLILKTVHNLKPYQISRALHLKEKSVKNRIDRGIRHLNYMQSGEYNNGLNKNSDELSITHAFEVWQDRCIDSFEAFANMDPHNFSYEYEEDTIRKMNDVKAKPRISDISNDDNKGILLVAIAIFLIFTIIFTVWLGTTGGSKEKKFELVDNPDAEVKASESVERNLTVGNEDFENIITDSIRNNINKKNDVNMSDEKADKFSIDSEEKEEIDLDREFYSYDGENIIFINSETGMIYLAEKADDAKEFMSISETMSEHNGVHQVGYNDNTVYIAFMDGSGGYIEPDSFELTVVDAWQTDWFENKKALAQEFKNGVAVGDVIYKFK